MEEFSEHDATERIGICKGTLAEFSQPSRRSDEFDIKTFSSCEVNSCAATAPDEPDEPDAPEPIISAA
ncbi:hypothetical protein [uncultured Celeribacter sp.]|uniref:hypothetical protein n=1 Tax=uncultured Celeribacter sp. TaxID=1303376 RepID=UPI002AA612FB|nr:hypothetical protein [uncultured Celeribacter sp.]